MKWKLAPSRTAALLAAALVCAAPAALPAQTKPKTHTPTHRKTGARKPAAKKRAAKPTGEEAHFVNKAAADRVHAWVTKHHSDTLSTSAEPRPARTVPVRPEAQPEAAPAAAATPDTTAGREATAADFDRAAAERRKAAARPAAKPDPRKFAGPPQSKSSSPDAPETPATAHYARPSQARLTYVHGHLVVPPPLRGSHEILVHQNVVADREGLDRIQDAADLREMRAKRLLVDLPAGSGLRVDPRLPSDRRYTRPWTAKFLSDLARAHAARFHSSLQVNSAVRTVDFQARLLEYNGNAAPTEGDTASPHLTGEAVDLAKHGLSRVEIAWMRAYLAPLIAAGKIDVEEEFQQACFHISVYRKYDEPLPAAPRRLLAGDHEPAHPRARSRPAASIAAALP